MYQCLQDGVPFNYMGKLELKDGCSSQSHQQLYVEKQMFTTSTKSLVEELCIAGPGEL